MIRTKFGILFCLFFLTALLYACISVEPKVSNDTQKSFINMFPIEDMNKSVQLRTSSLYNDRRIGSTIYLTLSNESDKQILFPVGLGLRIFIIEKGEWVEVQNRDYVYGNEILLEPKIDVLMHELEILFDPNIIDNGKLITLRAIVIGDQLVNGFKAGIQVAAYKDLILVP